MKIKLTYLLAQEILHKLGVLADTTDLQDDYKLTQDQADDLARSVPQFGGVWEVPDFGIEAVVGEMKDHATVLRSMANDALNDGDSGGFLRDHNLANRIERIASCAKGRL